MDGAGPPSTRPVTCTTRSGFGAVPLGVLTRFAARASLSPLKATVPVCARFPMIPRATFKRR